MICSHSIFRCFRFLRFMHILHVLDALDCVNARKLFDKYKLIHCLLRFTNESLISSGTPFRICGSNVDNFDCPIALRIGSPS